MSDSVRPQRQQPTRLPRPWDSPGKNTGVSCHFLLQCMKVKSENEVAQSCPTPSDPMDCSPAGPSVRGLLQARALEWSAMPSLLSHFSWVQFFATPWTAVHQAPPFVGFPGKSTGVGAVPSPTTARGSCKSSEDPVQPRINKQIKLSFLKRNDLGGFWINFSLTPRPSLL